MSYKRVIPRDLFNEAKLLKCMGQLALKILDGYCPDGLKIEIEESGNPFCIVQDESNGALYVSNYPITINDFQIWFKSFYNSKKPYPFYCEWDGEEIVVFDDQGNFTDEFCNLVNILK